MEKLGVKEVKELLVAVNEVSVLLVKQFKDGAQLADAAALMAAIAGNDELKEKLFAAYMGVGQVPAEIKDVDLQEGLELAGVQLSYIPKIVEAMKKDVVAA